MENRTHVFSTNTTPPTLPNWTRYVSQLNKSESADVLSSNADVLGYPVPSSTISEKEVVQTKKTTDQSPESSFLISDFEKQPDQSTGDTFSDYSYINGHHDLFNDGNIPEHHSAFQVQEGNSTNYVGDIPENVFHGSSTPVSELSSLHSPTYDTDHGAMFHSNGTVLSEEERIYAGLISDFEALSVPISKTDDQNSWFGCFGSFVERKMNRHHDPSACQMKFDGASCWPETTAGTWSTISCFAEFNGVPYDSTRE